MGQVNLSRLRQDLSRHEGRRTYLYSDATGKRVLGAVPGKITIGIGHNIEDNGLPDPIIDALLDWDVAQCMSDLDRSLPWWRKLDDVRMEVLVNMCFNLGISRLLGFKNTLRFIRVGMYRSAARGMLSSLWAKQVGRRAIELARQMEHGTLEA